MTVFSTRRLAVFVLLAAFALTLSGCWNPFAPDPGDPVPIVPVGLPRAADARGCHPQPQDGIRMEDAEEYLDCLSEDFIFFPSVG